MARFEDFTKHEKHVLREAMAWAQSEFYDPGHTPEDRETLQALIMEAKAAEFTVGEAPATYRHIDPATVAMPDVVRPNDGFLPSMTELAGERMRAPERPADAPENAPDMEDGNTDKTATEPPGAPERTETMAPWWMHSSGGRSTVEKPTRKVAGERPAAPRTYKGFLYIKCAKCGHIHAFCAKVPVSVYRCGECGGRTPLDNMVPLRITCECGARHNYLTNVVTDQMDVTCFTCGAPVAVEWNEKLRQYTTIGAYAERPHKKKGGRK